MLDRDAPPPGPPAPSEPDAGDGAAPGREDLAGALAAFSAGMREALAFVPAHRVALVLARSPRDLVTFHAAGYRCADATADDAYPASPVDVDGPDAFPGEVAFLLCHLRALEAELMLYTDRDLDPVDRFIEAFERLTARFAETPGRPSADLFSAAAATDPATRDALRELWHAGVAALREAEAASRPPAG